MYTTSEQNQLVRDSIHNLCNDGFPISNKEKDTRAYILEKSLRIASATLALAALLDTRSPVRTTLERTSLGLVEHASHGLSERSARSKLVATLRTLAALLEAAALGGTLAFSNTAILTNEITDLLSLLAESGWAQGRVVQETSLLAVAPVDTAFADEPLLKKTQTSKGHDLYTDMSASAAARPPFARDMVQQSKDVVGQAPQHYRDRVQDVQKDRRATILALLQRKDRISVRDVAAVIKDCSEKTLQRELLALVGQGVLVKEGERRWSMYRLA